MKDLRKYKLMGYATVALACGAGALAGSGLVGVHAATVAVAASDTSTDGTGSTGGTSKPHVQLDRSGRTQVGKASYYAQRYSGRTMADGTPMRMYSNNAASLTLPLGTTARVTNVETGKSAIVTIRDRGPYVNGRIIDLSTATAREIGLSRSMGLVNVKVTPLSIPLPDGSVRLAANGRSAHDPR